MTTHPIPDIKERAQALDPSQSFIVQAPAGSGKTEILTQRFLALLNYVKQPEEILAITFTKKSAAEMRARIINALKRAATETAPILPHAKTTWDLAQNVLKKNQQLQWNLLDNPNRLHIQTIDSFNVQLTKQLPILSHFGASPDITDDPIALYREAAQEFLSHLEENVAWSDAIAQLLIHMDNNLNKVELLLINMLAKRDQWLPYITLNSSEPELRRKLEGHLAAVMTDILSRLEKNFPKEQTAELLSLADFAAYHLKEINPESPILHCSQLTRLPSTKITDINTWFGLSELLINKEHQWRKNYDKRLGFPAPSQTTNPQDKQLFTQQKKRMSDLIHQFTQHEPFRLALIELNLAPSLYYAETQWQTLDALHQALRIVVAQLHLVFQKKRQIDYIESAQAALAALGPEDAPTDMTLALDYQLQHILIDEFQDTSHSQYRLLEKLTAGWDGHDGRTLFIVGDPMQSIYRFREAEVGLFIQIRSSGLGNITLYPLTLSVNFRSTESIVNWVNTHFQQVLPPFEDISTGAVSYNASVANPNSASAVTDATSYNASVTNPSTAVITETISVSASETNPNITPIITENLSDNARETNFHSIPMDDAVKLYPFIDSNEMEQATAIVNLIKNIKEKRPKESIAILVRSRSHLQTIIPALKKAHLKYRAIDIDPLNTRPVIQDLLALTRALLHPADKIAWLAILRAPWCGLELNDLLHLSGHHSSISLYEQLQSPEIICQLSPAGQERINRIKPILLQKIADRYRLSIRNWTESTWLLLGGPACVTQRSDLEDTTAFFQLLESMDQTGAPFNIDTLIDKVSQLYAAADTHADNTLQIMTIHNAKGLEFDNVILPHLQRRSPIDDKQLLLWMERQLQNGAHALLIAPVHAIGCTSDPIYDYIKRQNAIKTDHENGRLLYVAATRAKKQLHLLFSLEKNDNNEIIAPAASSLLRKLWHAIPTLTSQESLSPQSLAAANIKDFNIHDANINAANIKALNIHDATNIKAISRLTLTWQNPIQELQSKQAFHNESAGFRFIENTPRFIGSLIHLLLQKLSQYGKDWWDKISLENKYIYIQNYFTQHGISPKKITQATETVLLAIRNILLDPRGQWILQNHLVAKNEYPLTATINGKIQSFIIDRTFIDTSGTRWIIDYKTTDLGNRSIENFIEAEKNKYYQQMLNYAEAICKIDHRPIKLGLYFPLVPAWYEWG